MDIPSITGYRNLTRTDIHAINEVKAMGTQIEELLGRISAVEGVDKRWLAIGETDLQKGLMAVTRAIAKPTTF